jgi:hypothetical protein
LTRHINCSSLAANNEVSRLPMHFPVKLVQAASLGFRQAPTPNGSLDVTHGGGIWFELFCGKIPTGKARTQAEVPGVGLRIPAGGAVRTRLD